MGRSAQVRPESWLYLRDARGDERTDGEIVLNKAREVARRINRSGLLRQRPTIRAVRESSMVGLRHYVRGSGYQLTSYSAQKWHRLIATADRHFQTGEFAQSVHYLNLAADEAHHAAERTGLSGWGVRICGASIVDSIGHMAVGLGVRARFRELGWSNDDYLVLASPWAANPRLLTYWQRFFPIAHVGRGAPSYIETALWPIVEEISSIGRGRQFRGLYQATTEAEVAWEQQRRPPLLTLDDEDREVGRGHLTRLGLPEDAWFVTLHVREDPSGTDFGRNTNVLDYVTAIDTVTRAGGWVVRLGDPVMTPLPGRAQVIDLAGVADRRPSVDVYSLAACHFMIGTSSGPVNVPSLFGRPVLQTNTTGFGALPYFARSLCLPKLMSDRTGRVLSLQDLIERGLSTKDGRLLDGVTTGETGLLWRGNSPDDIALGVQEMLDHAWERPIAANDQRLAELRASVVPYAGPRISPNFLQQHLD